jgi:uncharacterized protein (DUF305 family)
MDHAAPRTLTILLGAALSVTPIAARLAAQGPAAQNGIETPVVSRIAAQVPNDDPDENYIQKMKLHNRLAIDLAKLASERAAAAGLKRVAADILRIERTDAMELTRVEQQLPTPRQLAESERMNDPVTIGLVARLRKLSGKEFDGWMLSTLLSNQEMALQLSEKTPLQAAPLKAFAHRHAQTKAAIVDDLRRLQRSLEISGRAS